LRNNKIDKGILRGSVYDLHHLLDLCSVFYIC